MAKVRDVLVHVLVETASRQRKCHRSKSHAVKAGEKCLVVRQGLGSKNYCKTCATEILAVARERLSEITSAMGAA